MKKLHASLIGQAIAEGVWLAAIGLFLATATGVMAAGGPAHSVLQRAIAAANSAPGREPACPRLRHIEEQYNRVGALLEQGRIIADQPGLFFSREGHRLTAVSPALAAATLKAQR